MTADEAPLGDLIRRERLADQAYDVLRQLILERRIVSGDRLSVPELADRLGMSRSPVREAVQRLVSDGLGVEAMHRGAVVASLRLDEVDDLYAVRALLEGEAARLAATRKGPLLATRLEQLVAEHEAAIEAAEPAAVVRADLRFHEYLADEAANPYLRRAIRPLLGRAQIAMLAGDLHSWPPTAAAEHRRIVGAVVAGRAAEAERAARNHLERVRDRLRAHLSQ